MATVSSNLALDMSATNMFAALGTSLLASKGSPEVGAEPSRFYFLTPPDKKGISTSYVFQGEGTIKYGSKTIKGLTDKKGNDLKLVLPKSGTVEGITLWDFSHSKFKAGKDPYTLKANIFELDLDIKTTVDQLLKYNIKTQFSKFVDAAKSAYEGLFSKKDSIFGSKYGDKLYGYAENDVLQGNDGADKLDGGSGSDWASYSNAAAKGKSGAAAAIGVTANLSSPGSNDGAAAKGDSYKNIENLEGSRFDDTLTGNGGRNVIKGGAGSDILTGGGKGDVFVFGSEFYNGGVDTVTDFKASEGDLLAFDRFLLRGPDSVVPVDDKDGMVPLNESLFWADPTGLAHDLDDRFVYNTSTGELFYDSDGSDPSAGVLVARLTGAPELTAASIRVADFDFLA